MSRPNPSSRNRHDAHAIVQAFAGAKGDRTRRRHGKLFDDAVDEAGATSPASPAVGRHAAPSLAREEVPPLTEKDRQDADRHRQPDSGPYDFTGAMTRAIARLTRLPVFQHVDAGGLACSFTQCRTKSAYGWYAKVVPLRFDSGAQEKITGRYRWVWPTFQVDGQVKLYLVSFYLPRFLNLSLDEKLHTVVHELYHVSPNFDGDLRRFKGRNYAHGHSRKAYDDALIPVCQQARHALALEDFDLFKTDHAALKKRYGSISGTQYGGLNPQRFQRY